MGAAHAGTPSLRAGMPMALSSCFRDSFCRRFLVPRERYEIEMLRRCLSRRARWLRPFLHFFAEQPFSLDRLFIESIGRARSVAEFRADLQAFRDHPSNRRWARHSLKLRLSVWRIWDVADEVLPHLQNGDANARPGVSQWN